MSTDYPIKPKKNGWIIEGKDGKPVGKYIYPEKWKAEVYRKKLTRKDNDYI